MENPIRTRRLELKLTQGELGVLLGVSPAYACHLETGDRAVGDRLGTLADILGVEPEVLGRELQKFYRSRHAALVQRVTNAKAIAVR